MKLTPYHGPGKYEAEPAITAVLHTLSLEGADDECGSVAEGDGWYGLLRGPFTTDGPFAAVTPVAIAEYGLQADDLAYLASLAGVILHESPTGFVSATFYTSAELELLDRTWDRIASDASFD